MYRYLNTSTEETECPCCATARNLYRQAAFWQDFAANGLGNSDRLPRTRRDDAPKDKNEAEGTDRNGFSNPNTFCIGDSANRKWEYR
jgi:hypothetical protein